MRYRKKPVEVEALQYTEDNKEILMAWGCPLVWDNPRGGPVRPFIITLEGNMALAVGDFVIKGVAGEFYPCKPDIFDLTYENINSQEDKEL